MKRLYGATVRSADLGSQFKEDFPSVTFKIRLYMEAEDLDEAYKKAKAVLFDKHVRQAIAGRVCGKHE